MKHFAVLLIALLALPLAACDRGNVSIERNGNGVNVTMSLTEAEVNAAVAAALAEGGNPLLRDPQVDLQAGQIVVSGTHERRDGGGPVSGTITISIGAANGALTAQVTSANIEGWDANDARIAQFNERLAQGLGRLAERSNGRVTVQSVNVTDSALDITLAVTQ